MRRKRKFLIAISLAILAGGITFFVIERPPRELVDQRNHIEREYSALLATIEEHAADPAVNWQNSESTDDEKLNLWEREAEIYDELAAALPPHLVYWATWSSDGHHGLRGLDSHEGHDGYETYPRPVSWSTDRRRVLRPGRSFEGDDLLVFEGRVPHAHKRVYTIAFYKKEILDQMQTATNANAQQGAGGKRE